MPDQLASPPAEPTGQPSDSSSRAKARGYQSRVSRHLPERPLRRSADFARLRPHRRLAVAVRLMPDVVIALRPFSWTPLALADCLTRALAGRQSFDHGYGFRRPGVSPRDAQPLLRPFSHKDPACYQCDVYGLDPIRILCSRTEISIPQFQA